MEIVRKQISVNESRSHRDGLLPFVSFNGDGTIQNVEQGTDNGNYGGYVCDFAIISAYTATKTEAEIEYIQKDTVSSLTYVTLLKKYYQIKKSLQNGIFIKKVKNATIKTPNPCGEETEEAVDGWTDKFDDTKETYDFEAVSASCFSYNGIYYIKNEGCELSSEFAVIINDDDFELLQKCENDWSDFFALYEELSGKKYDFGYSEYKEESPYRFCKEFEKYCIGTIIVPNVYSGSQVPTILTCASIPSYKKWFANHKAAKETNKATRIKWEERGGDAFNDYLTASANTMWQTRKKIEEEGVFMSYEAPSINIPIFLTDDAVNEKVYRPYEYSYSSYTDGDVTILSQIPDYKEYVAPSSGVGSALTPSFITFGDGEVLSESKLSDLYSERTIQIDDEIRGVFKNFVDYNPESGITGQLFKCTYKVEESKIGYTEVYFSGFVSSVTTTIIDEESKETRQDVKNRKVGKTFVGSINEEPPVLASDVHQVIGTTILSSTTNEFASINNVNETNVEDGNGTISALTYWSAVTKYVYGWWECEKFESNDNCECHDGEAILSGEADKYRNLTILSCIPSVIVLPKKNDVFYFMARYDNGWTNWKSGDAVTDFESHTPRPFDLPYVVDEKRNCTSLNPPYEDTVIYDKITDLTPSGDFITIKYVMGLTSGNTNESTSGIHYRETMNYYPNKTKKVMIDGVHEAELLYNSVDDSELYRYVYNQDFRLYRKAKQVEITGMEVGTQWTSESAIVAKLITKDMLDGLQDDPIYKVSITFDRGAAAAWEKRYKLAECNTFEDLKNYGNNYFKL